MAPSQPDIPSTQREPKAYLWVSDRKYKPLVFDEIQQRMKDRLDRLEIEQDSVVKRYAAIADADPNHLSSFIVSACRYCHGHDHAYQWRTEREFNDAFTSWAAQPEEKKAITDAPDNSGGYGYSLKLPPHEDCPECEGFGVPRIVFKDTTRLPEQSRRLYAGVKQTANGIEVMQHDQMKALDALARHTGAFEKDNQQKNAGNAIANLIEDVNKRGSKAPINPDVEQRGDDAG